MNLTQRQMRAFLALAQLGHFTQAAERLHITQAGLSAMIKDIETQLDCRLFERTTRSVSLTDEGRQLFPVAHRVLGELDAVLDTIHRVSSEARGVLTIGVTPTIAASVMPWAYRTFADQHPHVSLRVRDIGRDAIQDGVADGTLDAGFGAFFRPAFGIDRRAIAAFPLIRIKAASTRRRAGPSHTTRCRWADLGQETLLALPRGNPIQVVIEEQLRRAGVDGHKRIEFENIATLLSMAEEGLGTTILPSFIAPAARRHTVLLATMDEPEVPVSYFQITRKGRLPLPTVGDMATILQSALLRLESAG